MGSLVVIRPLNELSGPRFISSKFGSHRRLQILPLLSTIVKASEAVKMIGLVLPSQASRPLGEKLRDLDGFVILLHFLGADADFVRAHRRKSSGRSRLSNADRETNPNDCRDTFEFGSGARLLSRWPMLPWSIAVIGDR